MTKFKKTVSFLLVTLAAISGTATYQIITGNPGHASKKIKIIAKKTLASAKYRINSNKAKKAYAYTSNLNRHVFKLSNYQKTTFNVNKQQTVSINGKKRVYFYVKSTGLKKNISGWVWHKYLTKQPTKVTSKKSLEQLIKATTDLQPSASVLSLSSTVYNKYQSTFNKEYNVGDYASDGVFKNHTASVYVADSSLMQPVAMAIAKWNSALGKQVFTMGTQNNHTITVKSTDGDPVDWDGYFVNNTISINNQRFNDSSYATDNLSLPSELNQQVETLTNQASSLLDKTNDKLNDLKSTFESDYDSLATVYNLSSSSQQTIIKKELTTLQNKYNNNVTLVKQNYEDQLAKIKDKIAAVYSDNQDIIKKLSRTNYWITVVAHELGHTLGLYHTPYLDDVMYSSTSNEADTRTAPIKYTWNKPKDFSVTSAIASAIISKRDINRAKLTMQLGYW
ncbi:matrixin family metalloprotease [Lentilactobacillus kosonis]|uniref:Uncharacterized membrane protein n=1 Tax=Lentilactobacillus kosonis TaxID=2810561 RepID=A0A401FNE0_9LACO|nr:matrixin family metalloprotease [Lentilactobacillus kosonis]GAY73826.1 uncharacterized membrane protein [Lentilactobacillus kosonis]